MLKYSQFNYSIEDAAVATKRVQQREGVGDFSATVIFLWLRNNGGEDWQAGGRTAAVSTWLRSHLSRLRHCEYANRDSATRRKLTESVGRSRLNLILQRKMSLSQRRAQSLCS